MLLYLVAFAIFAVLDLIWLGVIAKDFYRSELGSLMTPSPNWAAGIAFYVIYIWGLVAFVAKPAMTSDLDGSAFIWGAAFGLVAYATYDLTNLTVIKGFPAKLAFVDMAWGSFLSGITAMASVAAVKHYQ
jgi:uncharacterized membrane protein